MRFGGSILHKAQLHDHLKGLSPNQKMEHLRAVYTTKVVVVDRYNQPQLCIYNHVFLWLWMMVGLVS